MGLKEKQLLLHEYVKNKFKGRKRKWSELPYFSHLISVAEKCVLNNIKLGFEIGLLHDIYEDTPTQSYDLIESLIKMGYTKEEADVISNRVIDLTKTFTKEDYPHLNREQRAINEIKRLRNIHPTSQTIKYIDIMDNCKDIVNKNIEFARIYVPEKLTQLNIMDKGDRCIRKKAIIILSLTNTHLLK